MIFANCEAITICVFMSSGERSSTVSQNVARRLFEGEIHVSTIDHISLHSTSVATYGYLKSGIAFIIAAYEVIVK